MNTNMFGRVFVIVAVLGAAVGMVLHGAFGGPKQALAGENRVEIERTSVRKSGISEHFARPEMTTDRVLLSSENGNFSDSSGWSESAPSSPITNNYVFNTSIFDTEAGHSASSIMSSDSGSAGSGSSASSGGSGGAGSDGSSSEGGSGGGGGGGGGSSGGTPSDSGDSGGSIGGGGAAGAFSNIHVTVISSMERLLRDDISAPGTSSAELFCAKNETESFQIIVTNQSYSQLRDVELHVSDWQGPSAAKKPKLTLFREHYVKVEKTSYGLPADTPKGWYPDALIPFIDPYTNQPITSATYLANHQTVSSRSSQGYWADVRVDADVPAGTYTCSILVTSMSSKVAEIPVTLTVWDFTLPAVPVWTAWFCGLRKDLNVAYGMSRETRAWEEILLRHQQFFFEHGVYPSYHKSPSINETTGEVVFTADYVNGLRDFVNKFGARGLCLPTLFADAPDKLKTMVIAYHAFSQANPWAGMFFYYIDEPSTPEEYNRVKQCGQILDAFAPSIKLLVTEQIAPEKPGWPNLEGIVDIWVPTWELANIDDIKRRQLAGDDVWSYTALTHRGFTNWLLDEPLIHYRTPAWFSYVLELKGILYWQTTVWAGVPGKYPVKNPWLTQESYVNEQRLVWNGEGSLIYPGTQAGVQGPIGSMRLKVFRDSVEDHSYFKLLESKQGMSKTVELVSQIAKDFSTYTTNTEAYAAQRRVVAEKILFLK